MKIRRGYITTVLVLEGHDLKYMLKKLKDYNNEKNHHPDFSEPVVFELRTPGQFDRRREREIPSSNAAI